MGQTGFRTPDAPDGEGDDGDQNDGRHKPGSHYVCQALNGCTGALRVTHHAYNLCKKGFSTDAVGPHDEGAGAIDGAARNPGIGGFFHGNGLACDHRFIYAAAAFQHQSVDRNFLAGPDAEAVSHRYVFERYIFLAPVRANFAGGFRGQPQQRLESAAGLAAGAQLQDLAQQDQSHDHRGGLEVDRHGSISIPE